MPPPGLSAIVQLVTLIEQGVVPPDMDETSTPAPREPPPEPEKGELPVMVEFVTVTAPS